MTDKTKGWPPKRRAEYAARIKQSKIWRFATGPRTTEGKARSSRNAVKFSPEWQIVRLALLAQRQFLHQIKQIAKINGIRSVLHTLENPKYIGGIEYSFWHEAPDALRGNLRAFTDFAGVTE